MNYNRLICIMIAMAIMSFAYASGNDDYSATAKVTGSVTNVKGEAIPGVAVRLKGNSDVKTLTDIDGCFIISVPDLNSSLVLSSLGYNEQTVRIKGRDKVEVVLKESIGVGKYEYEVYAGVNVGGLISMSRATVISRIDSYKPASNLQIGFTAKTWLGNNRRWGLAAGIRWETKGMRSDVTVSDCRMQIIDNRVYDGRWTGKVYAKYNSQQLVIPITALYRLNQRIIFNLGPYMSYILHNDFKGNVYDGYLYSAISSSIFPSSISYGTYDFCDDLRKFLWGIQGGVSWLAYKHLVVNANLQCGCNSIFRSSFETLSFALCPICLNVGVAYNF